MKTRHWDRLGNGGVTFTELGFGSAPLGNIYRPITEAEAQATLSAAWDTGVRYLDAERRPQEVRATHVVLAAGAYGLGRDGLVRPLPGPAATHLGRRFGRRRGRRTLGRRRSCRGPGLPGRGRRGLGLFAHRSSPEGVKGRGGIRAGSTPADWHARMRRAIQKAQL